MSTDDLFTLLLDEETRGNGSPACVRVRVFLLFYTLSYCELEAAVANAQPLRLLRALRWTLVLLQLTHHTSYRHSLLRTLLNLFCVVTAQEAADALASLFLNTGENLHMHIF